MKLIIGLGNPGRKYEKTWHNLGWLALTEIAAEFAFGPFKKSAKLKAEIATGKIGKEKIILAKPQTFMNHSGLAAAAIMKYYKIPLDDIIVIHDDVDLPLGKIRIIADSSAGGHNGVKSLIENLKSKKFVRIKIGSRTAKTETIGALDYVLNKIAKSEEKTVKENLKKTVAAVEEIISYSASSAMNKFN